MTYPTNSIDFSRSPRASTDYLANSGVYPSPGRTVRLSQTGSIGYTDGINRSPKRVIATEELPSGQRGYSRSPNRQPTERVTVYERDPVVIGYTRPDELPGINVISAS